MTVILGATEEEAQTKLAECRAVASPEGGLVLMSGWTGVDFAQFDLDEEVRHVENDAGRTAMDNITRADPDRIWTVREVGQHVALGGIGPLLVGTPSQVADALEAWTHETDVDGVNLALTIMPGRSPTSWNIWRRNCSGEDATNATTPRARYAISFSGMARD